MRLPGLFAFVAFCYGASAASAFADSDGMHSINGVPLYIDGTQSQAHPLALSPALLGQVKSVTTLADALRILGPAYIAPDDSLHIPHWHFQDGTMLTLWPQGNETLNDTVSVYPRPDCGVPSDQCKDLILGRKPGVAQQNGQHGGRGGSGGGGTSLQSFMPLLKMIPAR